MSLSWITQLSTGENMKIRVRDESDESESDLPFFDLSYIRYSSSHRLFCHDFLQQFSLWYLISLWLNVCYLQLKQRLPFIKIRCKVNCKACILVYWRMRGTGLHSCKTYNVWKTSEGQKMSCLLVSHLLCLLNFDFKMNMLWYVLVKTDVCLQGLKL